MDSPLIQFYKALAPYQNGEDDGIYIREILGRDDEWFETRHDYIQWLFPLPEPSKHNFHAPILTKDDIFKLKKDAAVQDRFDDAFIRFSEFLGFSRYQGVGFNAYEFKWLSGGPKPWITQHDHNHLRITRMMASCRLVSLHPEMQVIPLYNTLLDLSKGKARNVFSRKTLNFWKNAAGN